MVVEAITVNDCGIYCIACPKKSLTTHANNKQCCLDISIYCEHADFCRFLIERIHSIDSMEGIFGGDKRE